jgi:2-polyprenyl-3-methyl-5-hydroxy-6-metoxy-1,4-benzoquinol methylase
MTADEQEAKTIATYDQTATDWAADHAKTNDWKAQAARFKTLVPSGSILEVGCGGGRDAAELISLGFSYYGTDASNGMINVARQLVPNGTFEVCNIYDVAKLGQRFDGFWACAALLHIPKHRIDEGLQAILATQHTHAHWHDLHKRRRPPGV